MIKEDILADCPEEIRNDETFKKLYRLEEVGVLTKEDVPFISVYEGSSSVLFVSHDVKGDSREEGFWGYFDFNGEITKALPKHLQRENRWYPQSEITSEIHAAMQARC